MIELNLEQKVCEEFVSNLFFKLRQMCSIGLKKENLILGGPGLIVEIDESLYAKVKHWKRKDLMRNQVWVFIDPDTGTCTNRIESLWRSCKAKFKEMNGCTRSMIQS